MSAENKKAFVSRCARIEASNKAPHSRNELSGKLTLGCNSYTAKQDYEAMKELKLHSSLQEKVVKAVTITRQI